MKNSLALRLGQILYYILLATSVVLVVIFYVNSGNINPDDPTSQRMSDLGPILNTFLYWTYFMVVATLFFTLVFPIASMVTNPKSGLKTLLSLGILALILFISYQLADDTTLRLPGYTGDDNVAERLKLTGMGIYTMYIMLGGAVLALLYSTASRLFR